MSPDSYVHGHHDSVLRSHRWRTVDNSAGYLRDQLVPGIRVLDVGCGPGTITADIGRLVAPGEVIGVDRSADVVDQAAARTGDVPGVSFRTGDVYALDFPDGTFDVAHAHQVAQHLADPVAALRELRRVTRPGGVVAVRDGDYGAMTWYPHHPGLDAWRSLYRELARANGGQPDAGRRLLAWTRAAGFTTVVPSASVWCFATPTDRAWWAGTWAERVVASDFARQARDRGLASPGELDRIARAWRDWAGHEDAWFLVPHGEVLATA